MELKITDDKENILLKRRELRMEINHSQSPTPKKQDLIKDIAVKYSVPEDHVVVDYIFTKKGVQNSTAKVKVYKEKPKTKFKEKKAGEKPKEEKSETQTSEAK